jgi:diadenosine tetraphosphate (Ap4A) HIT family hydrolase
MSCPMCSRWETDKDLRVAEFDHSFLTLNCDQFFPGYLLLFTKDHVTELFHLDPDVRTSLMNDVSAVAAALYNAFRPAKINYELLGNMVPHIHWHLVPRFADDPLWPRPIWSEPHDEKLLSPEEYAERASLVRKNLNL